MSVEAFVRERQARWKRLEALLDGAESSPERELGTERLQELVRLYRQAGLRPQRGAVATPRTPTCSAGSTTWPAAATASSTAGATAERCGPPSRRLFARGDPAHLPRGADGVLARRVRPRSSGRRSASPRWSADRGNGERLIPAEFFTESPRERVARIESSEERIDSVGDAAAFGASLYTHNIQVSFLAFTLGALTLVGGIAILFYNGVILGAVAGMYWLDGVQGFFFAWVGPHGALEIPAIVFGGAAGLRARAGPAAAGASDGARGAARGAPRGLAHAGGHGGGARPRRAHRGLVLAVHRAHLPLRAEDRRWRRSSSPS